MAEILSASSLEVKPRVLDFAGTRHDDDRGALARSFVLLYEHVSVHLASLFRRASNAVGAPVAGLRRHERVQAPHASRQGTTMADRGPRGLWRYYLGSCR